jgi:acetolactate synthase I/II/III large subunit
MYTASTAFIEALYEAGVSYIFANLGSDHPPIIEALAESRAKGQPVPRVITCPNEMVALSAAHGFAQIKGRAQAVFVHVETGTLALAGAVHNAAKGRIPVLIFAGTSPFTQEGEMRGSRNEFIHWIQDVFDQRGIVREYVKYDNEIRTGRTVKQLVHRAMQFAHTDPPGPVYLMAAREVMEEDTAPLVIDRENWPPVRLGGLPPNAVASLVNALTAARKPLVVTSYLGRSTIAFEQLIHLCHRLAVGVLESVPAYVNYPADDPLYVGNQWNEPCQNKALENADLILVLDSDVPWIPVINKPQIGATIYHIDIDPLKEQMPMWYIPARHVFRADVGTALTEVNECLRTAYIDENAVEARKAQYAQFHEERRQKLLAREQPRKDIITPEFLTACIRQYLDNRTIIVHEGVTNSKQILDHLMPTRPGSVFTSGGGALGWSGGAAIGAKLAQPENTVVSLTGDGSYLFCVPSSVHWIARHYETPFLQVIYNNRGWRAPKMSTLSVHPDGYASRAANLDVAFDPPPDYAGIAAAAGGALASIVRRPSELTTALKHAFETVRKERRSAVLDVWLPGL